MEAKNNMNRYHKKIYFPHIKELKAFNTHINSLTWQYSKHSLERVSQQLNFRDIENLLKDIKTQVLEEKDIFEYYKKNGIIERACYRLESNKHIHYILIVSKEKKLITIYTNSSDDNHVTLNKSLYNQRRR